jgi:hypothetical protein
LIGKKGDGASLSRKVTIVDVASGKKYVKYIKIDVAKGFFSSTISSAKSFCTKQTQCNIADMTYEEMTAKEIVASATEDVKPELATRDLDRASSAALLTFFSSKGLNGDKSD